MVTDDLSNVEVARIAADAALEVSDVLGLHAGAVGEVATYGEGARVRGVRVYDRPASRIRLYLVIRFGSQIDEVAEDVRAGLRKALEASAPEFARGTIDIHVADVSLEEEAPVTGSPEELVRWN